MAKHNSPVSVSKTILLIEDNLSLLENTAEILELENYIVLTAENGHKGIALLEKYSPDIILCDVMMPKMDGHEVLKAVKSNPITKKIPFIFLSAQSEKVDVKKGIENGADAFLTKPFESEQLLQLIYSYLKKKISVHTEGE